MISVLIPTRGRPELCLESVRSLVELADDPKRLQIMLRRDVDDDSTYPIREICGLTRALPLSYIVGEPAGYSGLHAYYNELAERAGDTAWHLVWNDDAVMRTKGWDSWIPRESGHSGDRLLQIHHGHFPVVANGWRAATGRIAASPHVDTYLCHVAEILVARGIMPAPVEAPPQWDVHHRADEIEDAGSERRRREVLGPDGTSARFFRPEMRAEIERDAYAILASWGL